MVPMTRSQLALAFGERGGGFQHPDPQLADGLVEMARENAVTIVKQEFALV